MEFLDVATALLAFYLLNVVYFLFTYVIQKVTNKQRERERERGVGWRERMV